MRRSAICRCECHGEGKAETCLRSPKMDLVGRRRIQTFRSLSYQTHSHEVTHKTGERCQLWAHEILSNHDSLTFEFLRQQRWPERFHPAEGFGHERIRQAEDTARDPLEEELPAGLQNPANLRDGFPPLRLPVNSTKVEKRIATRV